jgi:hypothetical protein
MQSSPSNVSGLLVKLCDFGHSRKVPDVKYFKYTGDIQRVPHHLFTNTGTDGKYVFLQLIQSYAFVSWCTRALKQYTRC